MVSKVSRLHASHHEKITSHACCSQDTRDWAAATLEQVVAAACHHQTPIEARSNLFAACTAAEQLDEGIPSSILKDIMVLPAGDDTHACFSRECVALAAPVLLLKLLIQRLMASRVDRKEDNGALCSLHHCPRRLNMMVIRRKHLTITFCRPNRLCEKRHWQKKSSSLVCTADQFQSDRVQCTDVSRL